MIELLRQALDIVLHVDEHLGTVAAALGAWRYALLGAIVFAETGLVVTPFLPGDSLLFAAGSLAATGHFDVVVLLIVLFAAAVLGDAANYAVGSALGQHVRMRGNRFIRREHLERTERFFERYGGKTIVIARFVPIVRTYAPFVAGACGMSYRRFGMFNVLGAVLWVGSLVPAGYFFGQLPWVRDNFGAVVVAIILISIAPAVVEILRERARGRAEARAVDERAAA